MNVFYLNTWLLYILGPRKPESISRAPDDSFTWDYQYVVLNCFTQQSQLDR